MKLTRTLPMMCFALALTTVDAAAQGLSAKNAEGQDARRVRRVDFAASLSTTSRLVFPGDADHDTRCQEQPTATSVGAGSSDLFGLLWVRHSHCLAGREDSAEGVLTIPFAHGNFELVDTRGRTVLGQYRGRLVATAAAGFDELGAWGSWLFQGSACISGGTRYANIVDDCAAGRSAPVRGLANLTTRDTTIYLNQTIGIGR